MNSVNLDMYQKISDDASPITGLEKQYGATTSEDIAKDLDEFERL